MSNPIWKYEDYSVWSRNIAKDYTRAEIEKRLGKAEGARSGASKAHLAAVESTHSMQSNSQRRAQTGNVVRANYEERMALTNALEIYEFYPEKTKGGTE